MAGRLGRVFALFLSLVVAVWWTRRKRRQEEEAGDDYLCFHCLEEAEERCRLPERPFARRCIAYTPLPDQPQPDQPHVEWEEQ
ncbi:hypothetical protein HS125_20385 [bacterium]|nr:hypothetical protein [bacterium]